MRETHAVIVHRQDYAPPAYWIRAAELTFDLDAAKTIVSSKLRIDFKKLQPAPEITSDQCGGGE